VPELLRLLRLRWLPVPCRLLRRFPRPFSSRSTFACDATWPSNQCSLPKRFDDSMCMAGSILHICLGKRNSSKEAKKIVSYHIHLGCSWVQTMRSGTVMGKSEM
jgi:hypothetical protein